MELRNKIVNFLGDSITEGVGADNKDKCYVSVLERDYGLKKANNYGKSGTRIAKQNEIFWCEDFNDDFISRADNMDKNADIIVVFGGTNDFGHGSAPMGDFESRDPYTFYGAMHTLILKLLENYENSRIVFCTPIHREYEEVSAEVSKKNCPLKKYVEIIKEVCEFYGVPIIDLWKVSGIQPRVPFIKNRLCPDGLHPNNRGHKILADCIAAGLKAL